MTRSQRYKSVNYILNQLSYYYKLNIPGGDRMYASELDLFEDATPEYDTLLESWSNEDGPTRLEAVVKWRWKETSDVDAVLVPIQEEIKRNNECFRERLRELRLKWEH